MERQQQTLADLTKDFGIILGTERYDECLSFYRETIGLPVWFEKEGLCCLRFGNGYLMIETGGMARDLRKPNSENPTMLRFNVHDVEATADLLRTHGIDVDVKSNACELKDADDPFFAN